MAQRIESMPDMGTVYNLIRTLYFNEQNGESKEMASKWLENLQHSIYGWKIADELLINKSDIASCYFAAQTLRTKIQNCFQELPEDSYSSLKDSIINHLKSIPETVVQTQLCLAITYLGKESHAFWYQTIGFLRITDHFFDCYLILSYNELISS